MPLNDLIAKYSDFWAQSMNGCEAEMAQVAPSLLTNPNISEADFRTLGENFAIITPFVKQMKANDTDANTWQNFTNAMIVIGNILP